jgi:hypothetical protein
MDAVAMTNEARRITEAGSRRVLRLGKTGVRRGRHGKLNLEKSTLTFSIAKK